MSLLKPFCRKNQKEFNSTNEIRFLRFEMELDDGITSGLV